MGLDVYALNRKYGKVVAQVRYGSYSSVHALRSICCLLAARHFKARANKERDVEARKMYEELSHRALGIMPFSMNEAADEAAVMDLTLDALNMGDTSYDFERYDLTQQYAYYATEFAGLYKLVDHSDCDGGHSAGDVRDIAGFFEAILTDLDAEMLALCNGDQDKADEYAGWLRRVADFFMRAADTDAFVEYA